MSGSIRPELRARIHAARDRVNALLLAELQPSGHWVGELSTSALSTATAVIALANVDAKRYASLVQRGLEWLAANANADGGWGDTIRSLSNLSTTALCWAAFGAAGADRAFVTTVQNAQNYLAQHAGSLDNLVPAIEGRYGKDRTFSVPIVMTLALSGRLGPDGWKRVRPLPFELAALPRGFFGALRLPVVSYALPALIAIGQVIYYKNPSLSPFRALTREKTLKVLTAIQPSNGGFLEATPLTSFVTMSLAAMGLGSHIVAQRGAQFLVDSVRPDGSWPIDTNLATWVTTLAIKGLRHSPECLTAPQRQKLMDWLLGQQYRVEHPYTGAPPGGWAWTDLPGGVPDADDTAGALIALRILGDQQAACAEGISASLQKEDAQLLGPGAIESGLLWLQYLQNRDGGIPTFCPGWGTLPFDQSTPELTAHAIRAWYAWLPHLLPGQAKLLIPKINRAFSFLERSQRDDGTWVPLWFGNEKAPHQENPVYGTASVLITFHEIGSAGFPIERLERAQRWLIAAQNPNGGWGGAPGLAPSIEETSLALTALSSVPIAAESVQRGIEWLLTQIEAQNFPEPAPIGLYFAKLWYYERLYPLVFAAQALGSLSQATATKKCKWRESTQCTLRDCGTRFRPAEKDQSQQHPTAVAAGGNLGPVDCRDCCGWSFGHNHAQDAVAAWPEMGSSHNYAVNGEMLHLFFPINSPLSRSFSHSEYYSIRNTVSDLIFTFKQLFIPSL